MFRNLSRSIWLLLFSVGICCVIYPVVLWLIGQIFFPFQANGSILRGPDGMPVGSRLIAQPFLKDGYFQSRPSAAAYNAAASASSSLAASNYALRDRVGRTLGPIVRYRSGANTGQLVAPDIERWFQGDVYQGNQHIVAQWADFHNGLAQAWVNADPTHNEYVDNWTKTHPNLVAQWVKDNPATPHPNAGDLAVIFFENFSKENPGKFPSAVTRQGANATTETTIEPVNAGSDIQAIFFDMWRQEHSSVDLQDVPGDLVTTSGSGLDPHITLQNAEYQLDRIVFKWAVTMKRDPAAVRKEIEQILQKNASAPWFGLAGEKIVNVLEVNLDLYNRYSTP